MTSLAVTSYDISLVIHITAVVVGFGATFAEAIMFPVALKVGTRHLPYVHRLQLAINQWLATPALVIIILTGIYQVTEADFDFADFWITGAFVIVIALGALLGAYFIPTDRRLGPMAEREIAAGGGGDVELSDEYQRGARTEGIVGSITGVLIIAAIYLMVAKPGL